MKFSTAVVLAASASMAAAYTTADIPTCAVRLHVQHNRHQTA